MGAPQGPGGGSAVELDIEGLRQVGKNTSALAAEAVTAQQTVEGVQGAMASIATRFSGSASTTTNSYDRARADQGTHLVDPEEVKVDLDTLAQSDSEVLQDAASELADDSNSEGDSNIATSTDSDVGAL